MTTLSSLSNLFLHSLVFLISFSILLIFHPSFALRETVCQDDDRSAMLQFKASFVFDSVRCDPSHDDTVLESWKVEDDCCSWDGVECNVKTGHVVGLDISYGCLYGSINSSSPLFQLVHLKNLNLSSNNFNGSRIPNGIGSLSQLKHLDLSFSSFTGQVPSRILELSELLSLNLSGNPLILWKPNLKDVVETFSHLVELRLSDVTVSSQVPQSLSNLTSISTLILKNCSLLGEFPPSIFRLPNLRVLSLRFNPNLTGYMPDFDNVSSPLEFLRLDRTNFSGKLPVSIGNLKSLRALSAGECGFSGVIPSSVGNLTNLDALDLYSNYLSGIIPSSLGNLFQLTYLTMSRNNFSRGTLDWVGTLTNLQTLDMGETNTYGPIPSSLRNLTQLTTLVLQLNQLTGRIPSWLGNFTQLTELYFGDNKLQGPIPEFIFRLPSLQWLFLESNNLSGPLKYDSFLQTDHLSALQLSFNHLSLVSSPYTNVTLPRFQSLGLAECNLREFPAFLRGQNEIEFLQLSSNNIEGYVPGWLFTLERLGYLNLANNSLTGFEHPPSILSSPNLRMMYLNSNQFKGPLPFPSLSVIIYDVSHNKFSGHISPLFCNLTSVWSLDLSSNNLSGTLPPCFGNFASVLNLRNNSLSGAIPNKFTSGCKLHAMDFSQNLFEGKVPNSLAKCSELEILNLDENRISDVFPSWLGVLPHLRVLSLRSNEFHGAIGPPIRKFEFGSLQVIDLSGNSLSGAIPNKFTSSCKLQVMDFSQNLFEGKVPNSLAKCHELEILTVYENQIYDVFPSWLGVLPHLRVLSLRSNEFHGAIGPPTTKFEFGSLQVIDLSGNNFKGILPLEYFRNWVAMKNVAKDHLAYIHAETSFHKTVFSWDIPYPYSIRLVIKGIVRAYAEIVDFLVVVDLSSNMFEGEIPEIIGTLRALQSLNFSNNILTGHIPSSIGNLTMLEALDLSQNDLSGQIPSQLAFCTFLAVFNVSHNSLTGQVPRGNQFDTFDNSSFSANLGLCGDMLSKKCGKIEYSPSPPSESHDEDEESPFQFNWEIVLIGCGTGLVIGVAFGCALDTRKYEWLVKKKFARRLRRRHRKLNVQFLL